MRDGVCEPAGLRPCDRCCSAFQVGLIMYFVRTPCEWGMDAISATLTFLWEVVGYVEGLFFKDLKQTMKKEQCEVKLLVTASMPGNPAPVAFR